MFTSHTASLITSRQMGQTYSPSCEVSTKGLEARLWLSIAGDMHERSCVPLHLRNGNLILTLHRVGTGSYVHCSPWALAQKMCPEVAVSCE